MSQSVLDAKLVGEVRGFLSLDCEKLSLEGIKSEICAYVDGFKLKNELQRDGADRGTRLEFRP